MLLRLTCRRRHALLLALLAVHSTSPAQDPGRCETGQAEAFLEANDVRARILNTGGLFWRGDPHAYEVPKDGGVSSIFTAGIWLGGQMDGHLRVAASTYGPYEFWPGPLTEDGRLPNPDGCSEFDRIYSLSVWDLRVFHETGIATDDLLEWPVDLGAPVVDGNGDPDDYNLEHGDLPAITGHQTHWWIMNDLGNEHGRTHSPPLGVEIRASAFAFKTTDPAWNQATFYRYAIRNPQDVSLDSTYLGFWVDPDLGHFNDDYVASDTVLGMGYVYNGDNDDENRYGTPPPAQGIDFIQGLIRDDDGLDNDRDGLVDEPGESEPMSSFIYYYRSPDLTGFPTEAEDYYNYMQARWRDGKKVTYGGNGRDFTDQPVNFMFPGDPVTGSFWSEVNLDGEGTARGYGERHFLMSAGPFTLEPDAEQSFVLAATWARGDNHLDSITELRKANRNVQERWDSKDFPDPDAVAVPSTAPSLVRPSDRVEGQPSRLTLQWEHASHAEAYLVEAAHDRSFDHRLTATIAVDTSAFVVADLPDSTEIYWRVRAVSTSGIGPVSETRRFATTVYASPPQDVLLLSNGSPAFLEIMGPGGSDPCVDQGFGCEEAGGLFVYPDTNSTGDFVMHSRIHGPEDSLPAFAPHDFEIRFTEEGSYAYSAYPGNQVVKVPFEVWDIGRNGPGDNDPSDDVQLIPETRQESGSTCEFAYGEVAGSVAGLDWSGTDWIRAYYSTIPYAEWEALVKPFVDDSPGVCPDLTGEVPNFSEIVRWREGAPVQNIVFFGNPQGDNYRREGPPEGTVIRFLTTPDLLRPAVQAAPGSGVEAHAQPFTLWWTPGAGESTEIQVSDDPTFGNVTLEETTIEDHLLISGLEENRLYYWRVRSWNGVFAVSDWSEVWSLTAGEVTNVATDRAAEVPVELTLDQNYPNPFNPSTTIRFRLPHAQHATVTVYDVLGRRVAVLVDGIQAAGWHEVMWSAAETASGLYFYEVATKTQRITRSMLLVR